MMSNHGYRYVCPSGHTLSQCRCPCEKIEIIKRDMPCQQCITASPPASKPCPTLWCSRTADEPHVHAVQDRLSPHQDPRPGYRPEPGFVFFPQEMAYRWPGIPEHCIGHHRPAAPCRLREWEWQEMDPLSQWPDAANRMGAPLETWNYRVGEWVPAPQGTAPRPMQSDGASMMR